MPKDLFLQPYSVEMPPFSHYKASMRHEIWDSCTENPYSELSGERTHKGLIGCVLWMGALYTCKWYTLSGHPSTSWHSCCCCRAEWISQRKEGFRTANGAWGGGGGFTEGGWVKGDLALGKDWLKAVCILGLCLSISPSSLFLTTLPTMFPFRLIAAFQ